MLLVLLRYPHWDPLTLVRRYDVMSSRCPSYFWVKNASFLNLFLMIWNSWENPRWTPRWRPLLVTSQVSSSPNHPSLYHGGGMNLRVCPRVNALQHMNYQHRLRLTCVMIFFDNDVTMPLCAFSREMLYARKVWLLPFCCAKFHENFEILWNFYLKAIIYASTEYWTLCEQICYFLDLFWKDF